MRMHNPLHPGDILKELWLTSLSLNMTQVAAQIKVSRKTVSEVVNGHASITPEMAMRLELVFGKSAKSWLGHQAAHDLWQMQERVKTLGMKRVATASFAVHSSRVKHVRILQRFFIFWCQAAFYFFHVFGRWQTFWANAALQQGIAHSLVVGDVLLRYGALATQFVFTGIEDRDLGGEVFGLQNDGGRKISQRSAIWHLPLRFHGLGGLAKQGVIALAANQRKVLVASGSLKDHVRQFSFCIGEFFTCGDAFCIKQALLN